MYRKILYISFAWILLHAHPAHADVTWYCHVTGYQLTYDHGRATATTLEKCSRHRRYWWPATDECTISVGVRRGILNVGNVPYVVCVPHPAGWHWKPFPGYKM
jgi:hypothetical protein